MAALRAAVAALAGSISDVCPTSQIASLSADGDTVSVALVDGDGKKLRISVTYVDAGAYPRSAALLLAEEDGGSLADRLAALSERLQDSAPLSAVLSKVCDALDIPVDEERLRALEPKQQAATNGRDMDEDGSDDEAMSEDGSGYGGGSSDGDDEQEDKELLVECGQRQGRWLRHEEELEKASATQQALSMEQGRASKRQIFSSKEGFSMLSNELLGFIRRQLSGPCHVSADSAGDDVYCWHVEMWKSAFRPDCQLAKDLQEVSVKWAVSSVQLRFTFMRGLHPFYPPRVEVVRPHLSLPLAGALASHPLLRLEHWDPWLTMAQLLERIKEFLEEHGRIDVSHPRNSPAASSASAYSGVQLALARLEALTDVRPSCYPQYASLYEGRSTRGREEEAGDVAAGAGAGGKDGDEDEAAAAADGSQQPKKQRTDGQAAAAAPAPAAAATPAQRQLPAQVVWAKGTGYGHGRQAGGTVWDPKAAKAAQEAQDEQLCGLLQGLADELNHELGGGGGGAAPTAANADGGGPAAPEQQPQPQAQAQQQQTQPQQQQQPQRRRQQKQQQEQEQQADAAGAADAGGGDPMDVGLTAEQQECIASVQSSVLLPLLVRELGRTSFTEMLERHQYYQPLLSVLLALCRPSTEHLLADNALMPERQQQEGQEKQQQQQQAGASSSSGSGQPVGSVAGAMRGLLKSAKLYRERMAKVLDSQRKQAEASSSSGSGSRPDKQAELVLQEAQRSMAIADQVLLAGDKLAHLTTAAPAAAPQRATRSSRRTTRAAAAAAAAAEPAPQDAAAAAGAGASAAAPVSALPPGSYEAALKPLVLDCAPIAARHRFRDEAAKDPMGLKTRVQRVTSEMAGIERLIVVSECSSIFVRVDDDNSFLWRVLITGPEDTPYGGGAFVFDIFFPPAYPNVPPKVQLITTGGGTVRFNPNLYNCGKVCLSLLGTWGGDKGENWNAEVSSAFQVLVSIQSLILVPEPYFNEPGYEQRGDQTASREYNKVIHEATIKWAMIDQLQHPPPEFADVIRAHFRLRAPAIRAQVAGWVEDAQKRGFAAHAASLQRLKAQLDAELDKLGPAA